MTTSVPNDLGTAGLMSLQQLATALGVDKRTARKALAESGAPLIRLGRAIRVRPDDVRRVIAAGTVFESSRTSRQPRRENDSPRRGATARSQSVRAGGEKPMSAGAEEEKPRRGWRQKVEPGLYRAHRVSCPASAKRAPIRRKCPCPWQVHVPTEIARRTRTVSFEADSLLEAQRMKKKLQGAEVLREDGRISLTDFFFGPYLLTKRLEPSSVQSYTRLFRVAIEPTLGSLRLDEISPEHIDAWLTRMAREAQTRREMTGKRNPQYVSSPFRVLSSILAAARRWRRISANPASGAELPFIAPQQINEADHEKDATKTLTAAQFKSLIEAAWARPRRGGRMPRVVMFTLARELGLRSGEVRGLRWEDFDFEERRVVIARQIDPVTGEPKHTKGKQERTLSISQSLSALLSDWRAERGDDGWILPGRDARSPMGITTPNAAIAATQRQAGLVDAGGAPLIVFHGLRHTCASTLLCNGQPLWKVSRFLGHSSVAVTERTYAHLLEEGELGDLAGVFDSLADASGGPLRAANRAGE